MVASEEEEEEEIENLREEDEMTLEEKELELSLNNSSIVGLSKPKMIKFLRTTKGQKVVILPDSWKQTNIKVAQHDEKVHRPLLGVTDAKMREIRDQVIRAKVYLNFAPSSSNSHLVKELRVRIKELEQAVGDTSKDSDLSKRALHKMKRMEATVYKASCVVPDCPAMATKLCAMSYNAEENVRSQKNQASYLLQLAARTTSKGLHCLSMQLTAEYFSLQPKERLFPNQKRLHDANLCHYAVFSDNILACAVVINSTVSSAMVNASAFPGTSFAFSGAAFLTVFGWNRMDMYIKFSDPLVAMRFDVNACTGAFGMNLFDLQQWRKQNLTSVYHTYLRCVVHGGVLGYKRLLWKAESLPLGWMTFYNQTVGLDRRWHLPGLGYESGITRRVIERAAVIHYDGIMKPWLDIGISEYKGYWSKHVNYDLPFLQRCNIHD
ncbi:probable galacturonosyltransferase 6 [Mangifera indica]|uniref:probable galacturonosyltransferase 6 n=1 Tax=Mangifera indica TaxID=29780 RepID=UPI001CFB365E|nr:probable galacturonosyltransferase 6 [Mangifera indica]